ncbi:hypothetical protein [Sphingomonas lenta]|uniref:Uncharacterized protein n=1 Tax=Sphingomonas lenta TaxID=1141887 RepID=A0A2A2SDK1_9SPHN|nr:hypothetical protein [Sphingomonas lenta]PAX07293.1 hypothetical protein CKY28_14840 [Sphingomonas lenta]
MLAAAVSMLAPVLLWPADRTWSVRVATLLAIAWLLWSVSRIDNHTGSCLMATVLVLIVLAVLALLATGVALPAYLR